MSAGVSAQVTTRENKVVSEMVINLNLSVMYVFFLSFFSVIYIYIYKYKTE